MKKMTLTEQNAWNEAQIALVRADRLKREAEEAAAADAAAAEARPAAEKSLEHISKFFWPDVSSAVRAAAAPTSSPTPAPKRTHQELLAAYLRGERIE